jgi:protein TonB
MPTASCFQQSPAGSSPRTAQRISLHPSNLVRRKGDWHYQGIPPPGRIPWASLLISAALHAGVLLGFNHHAPAVTKIVAVEPDVIRMEMPEEIKDPDEAPPADLQDEADQTPAVDVPTLAELPGSVDVNMGLVQPMDMRVPVQADLNAAKISIIPVNIAHGPRSSGGGLKNIFDLGQLDRIPEAVTQMPPHFPQALKHDYTFAQVMVEFIVDSDGNVRAATVVESTAAAFDQAAVDGVSKWHFRPGMKAGRRVNTRMRVPIRFKVSESGDF